MAFKTNKSEIKKAAGCLVVLLGASFILTSAGLILALVTGSSLFDFFREDDDGSSFGLWKAQFWIALFAALVLKLTGGKLRNLRFWEGFPYEEDEEEKEG